MVTIFSCLNPNITISLPIPYNIQDLYQIQLTTHASTLINCLNDNGTLDTISRIRLKEMQLANWILEDIFMDIISTDFNVKGNLLSQILKELSINNIIMNSSFGRIITIREYLQNNKLYKSNIISLRKRNLYFIDQIFNSITDYKLGSIE